MHGQNYFETFAPIVSLENVRMVLAMAAHFDWEAYQVDVKTAFQNAPLDEDVYMTVPEGVDTKNGTASNCVKLNKALYGLKQASRAWNRERSLSQANWIQTVIHRFVRFRSRGTGRKFRYHCLTCRRSKRLRHFHPADQ